MGHEFVFPLIGGGLIGLGATLLLFSHGKVAGVSGLIEQAITSPRADRGVAAWFLSGLLLAGLLSRVVSPEALPAPARSLAFLLVAGTMVGLGTRLSRGCTSGHGIFGTSRFSPRSIVATITFLATAILATLVAKHLFGGFS
jgi:uncharacterized membrane protein YedE/YeeE